MIAVAQPVYHGLRMGAGLLKTADKYMHGARLIVSAVSCVVGPGGLETATAATTGYFSLRALLTGKDRKEVAVIDRVAKSLEQRLAARDFHMPREGDVLLPQMLEAAAPTPRAIAAAGLDAPKLVEAMAQSLTSPDHTNWDLIKAFKNWVTPVFEDLCNDPKFVNDIGPAIFRELLARQERLKEAVEDVPHVMIELLEERGYLKQPGDGAVPLGFLIEIAEDFGGAESDRATDVIQFLKDKATEMERLASEIAAMKGLSVRIDNIRIAATDAVRNGNLEEARGLLNNAREIQKNLLREPLEANAALMARTAEIDLIEGKVQDAFNTLSAAADSFAGIDSLEPARRRQSYGVTLHEHGERYGGPGLVLAVDMYSAALEVYARADHPVQWATIQNNLGAALRLRGERTGGPAGAGLLGEAVAAYRAALEVHVRTDHPVQWAMIQNNLGIALLRQGERTGGAEGAEILAEAVAAYRAALEVRTRADHPFQWAMTQNNLGIALANQGKRTSGAVGAELLAEAAEAFRAALEVRTRADHPVNWASTQNNLAIALSNQGERTRGAEGMALLAEAVEAFRTVLEVRTRADHPVQWAETRENLAITEEDIAKHEGTDDPRPHLETALAHVDAALTVYDPEHMPYDHGTATRLRDEIKAALEAL